MFPRHSPRSRFYAVAVYCSVAFLVTKNFKYDSVAVSSVEVAQVFTLVNLVTGSIWGHIIWGIWWTWDLRLTSQFMCFMLYLGYLLMRPAIAEATQRATMSAILAIFAAADVPLVFMAIRLHNVRTQHPARCSKRRPESGSDMETAVLAEAGSFSC